MKAMLSAILYGRSAATCVARSSGSWRSGPRYRSASRCRGWDYLLRIVAIVAIVAIDVLDCERFLTQVLLEHPSVGHAASHFALSLAKYGTALILSPR